jgi:hypothetical protein
MDNQTNIFLTSNDQVPEFVSSCKHGAQVAMLKENETDLPIYFRLHKKEDSEKLVILFNGAVDREKTGIMTFQRWSWADDFDVNVLNIADGTLDTGEIQIGWGVGNEDFWFIDEIDSLIRIIMKELGVTENNLTLYGSSSGGFQAITCGLKFPKCNVVMENAQTDVRKYYPSAVEKLAGAAFKSITFEEFSSNYENRLSLSTIIDNHNKAPNTLIIQNINDKFHMKNHTLPLMNHLRASDIEDNLFEFYFYFGQSSHSPMNKDKLLLLIEMFTEKKDLQ